MILETTLIGYAAQDAWSLKSSQNQRSIFARYQEGRTLKGMRKVHDNWKTLLVNEAASHDLRPPENKPSIPISGPTLDDTIREVGSQSGEGGNKINEQWMRSDRLPSAPIHHSQHPRTLPRWGSDAVGQIRPWHRWRFITSPRFFPGCAEVSSDVVGKIRPWLRCGFITSPDSFRTLSKWARTLSGNSDRDSARPINHSFTRLCSSSELYRGETERQVRPTRLSSVYHDFFRTWPRWARAFPDSSDSPEANRVWETID